MPAHLFVQNQLKTFDLAWQAGRHAVISKDGSVFLAAQSGLNGRLVHILPNGTEQEIALAPVPSMRPTLHAGPWGLLVTAGIDHDPRTLLIWKVDDYVWPGDPLAVALEARVKALEARAPVPGPAGPQGPPGESADTTALERAIEDIQSELATMPGGTLGDDQTKALAWLVRFLRQIGVLS